MSRGICSEMEILDSRNIFVQRLLCKFDITRRDCADVIADYSRFIMNHAESMIKNINESILIENSYLNCL